MLKNRPFDRSEHVYHNEAFVELVKDAVQFFNGTPVLEMPPPENFPGVGVYAIYFIGKFGLYKRYRDLNRLSYNYPIYVGKAVPSGWRQARVSHSELSNSKELSRRLREHSKSIQIGEGLSAKDFRCRFVIFEAQGSDMIGTVEAALIKLNRPLWNSVIDGFGNHDPGSGRYQQAKSPWDVIHPGKSWADKCQGEAPSKAILLNRIEEHLNHLGASQ